MSALPLFKSEADFQAQLIDAAQRLGWRFYHTGDSRRSHPGFPDLCLVKPPRVLFAELKTEKGKVTQEQAQWMSALLACPGVEAYVLRPADWPAILLTLAKREAP